MIAIIDYGAGNLRSVQKAFEYLGFDALLTQDGGVLLESEAAVLPGVGAFGDAMAALRDAELIRPVQSFAISGRPMLGICLGQQLFFEGSEENPGVKGLGLIEGQVRRFPQMGLKVPHIGFNSVKPSKGSRLFKGIPETPYFYFVHSYYCLAGDRALSAGVAEYGLPFDAAIERGNLFSTQFHPEKSGKAGLRLLKNFGEIAKGGTI